MSKRLSTAISFFMSVILIVSAAIPVFAKTSEEADTNLQFKSDGSFKIMQLADIQDIYPMKTAAKKLIIKAIETQKPDLIVLTGDNISSGTGTKGYAKAAINQFMSIFEEYKIPVAATFGNHDDETTLATKEYQLSVYESYKCFIGCAGEDLGETNLCSYYVPIYSHSDSTDMKFNLWIMDSGTYNSENDLDGYACTTKAQIDWYTRTSEKIERDNGQKIPSLMFQHIVVPEIYDALTEVPEGTEGAIAHDDKFYILPQNAKGYLHESPCPPNYTNGQFDSVVSRGDVLGMIFGHDHVNTFELEYKDVYLINSPAVGFNSYEDESVGVRVITLNENDTWSFNTEVFSYFDLFDYNDDSARYLFKMTSDTSSFMTKFASFFKYIRIQIELFFQ